MKENLNKIPTPRNEQEQEIIRMARELSPARKLLLLCVAEMMARNAGRSVDG